jgi:hypothetical protein
MIKPWLILQTFWNDSQLLPMKSQVLKGMAHGSKSQWMLPRLKFCLARTPDREISKYKGRYCARGNMEEGDPETYAPVVAWISVRLFLILAMTLNWITCSINFSSAIVQAKFNKPVRIHLPCGFQSEKGS